MSAKQLSNEPSDLKLDEVTIDQIFVDESRNMRKFPPPAKEVQDLSNDIAERGQLQPVVVQP